MFVRLQFAYKNKDNVAMTFIEMVNYKHSFIKKFSVKRFIFRTDPPTAIQDRIIQACMAAWSASFAYEMNRLHSNLAAIDPELAAELRSASAECFNVNTPEARAFMKRVFKSIM